MQSKHTLDGVWGNQSPSVHAVPQPAGSATSTNSPPVHAELLTDAQGARLFNTSLRSFKAMQAEVWFPAPVILGPRQKRHLRGELLAAVASRAPRRQEVAEPGHLQAARARKVVAA